MGDRVYFTVDSGLVGVKVKDLSPTGAVELDSRVRALAPTPSGDRIYVATTADSSLSVVDRYSGRVQTAVTLTAPPLDLRMDALGWSAKLAQTASYFIYGEAQPRRDAGRA